MVVDKVFKIYCIIMDNSYTKYLKYKKKYIDLKSQIDNNCFSHDSSIDELSGYNGEELWYGIRWIMKKPVKIVVR